MARMDGNPGETIGAGIGWGWGVDANGKEYGIVAEAHGYKDKEAIEKELKWKLQEMAKIRGMELSSISIKSECFQVPKGKYGSVIVALVYVPWELKENEENKQEEMVEQEIMDQQIREERMTAIRGTATSLPFKSNTFDRILMLEVIEHMEKEDAIW